MSKVDQKKCPKDGQGSLLDMVSLLLVLTLELMYETQLFNDDTKI